MEGSVLINSAINYYKEKNYQKALDNLLRVREHPENDKVAVCYYLGLCYSKLNMIDDAVINLEYVIDNDDNIARLYQAKMILCYLYIKTDRLDEAEDELKGMLDNGYQSPHLYSFLSYIYQKQDKIDASIATLEESLQRYPDNPNLTNSLGYLLVDYNIDPQRGLELCKSALKLQPDNFAYLDSLGWAFYKNDDYKRASQLLQQALDQSRGDKMVLLHLQEVNEASNR